MPASPRAGQWLSFWSSSDKKQNSKEPRGLDCSFIRRRMSSLSLSWKEALSIPLPHHGQGSTTIQCRTSPRSQLLFQNIQLPVQPREYHALAQFKEKLSREERPEAEPSGARFQDSVILLAEAALPAHELAVGRRKPVRLRAHRQPTALLAPARHLGITTSMENRPGVQGLAQRRAGTSLNLCPLLSHSPPRLGVSFARSLPPFLPPS